MRIPLVGEPQMAGPQRTFTPLNPTTFDRVGQAGARVGAAIQGIGEEAGSLGLQIKTAIDAGTLAKAETAGEAHFQAFQDSLKDGKNPDNNSPATFLPRWKERIGEFTDAMSQDDGVKSLGPRARIEYQTMMGKYSAMTTQSVGHIATEKALLNGVGDIKTNYEAKLVIGDTKGAEATVQRGMATGLLNPAEGKQMIYEIPMKSEYNQAVAMMGRDPETGGGPIVLEKALKEQNEDGTYKFYPHVVGQQREALTFDAYRNARFLQAQTSQGYAFETALGQQHDPNKVARDLSLGKLTGPEAKALLKPEKVFTPENYSRAVSVISAYDPKADPSHAQEAQIWAALNEATPHLSPAASSRLNELFREKLKDASVLNTEVAKSAHNIINENFRLGVYGKYETRVKDKDDNWKTIVNPKVLETAQQARAKAQTMLNDWLQKPENADATPEEVQRFLAAVNKTHRLGALWAPVINPATGKAHP